MERRYSANPGEGFFTGGGLHPSTTSIARDNARSLTVREALQALGQPGVHPPDARRRAPRTWPAAGPAPKLLDGRGRPAPPRVLARFADHEGAVFLARFYRKYQGLTPAEAEALLLQRRAPARRRALASVLCTIEPEASDARWPSCCSASCPRQRHAALADARLRSCARPTARPLSLADRGYVARVHPLELWLVGYLRAPSRARRWPRRSRRAPRERQEVYGWLFKTRHKSAQDRRIRAAARERRLRGDPRAVAAAGLPLRGADAVLRDRARRLGRPAGGAGRADGHHRQRRRAPADAARRCAALRPRHAVRDPARAPRRAEPSACCHAEVAAGRAPRAGRRGRGRHRAAPEGRASSRRDGSEIAIGGKTGTGDHRFDSASAPAGRLIVVARRQPLGDLRVHASASATSAP